MHYCRQTCRQSVFGFGVQGTTTTTLASSSSTSACCSCGGGENDAGDAALHPNGLMQIKGEYGSPPPPTPIPIMVGRRASSPSMMEEGFQNKRHRVFTSTPLARSADSPRAPLKIDPEEDDDVLFLGMFPMNSSSTSASAAQGGISQPSADGARDSHSAAAGSSLVHGVVDNKHAPIVPNASNQVQGKQAQPKEHTMQTQTPVWLHSPPRSIHEESFELDRCGDIPTPILIRNVRSVSTSTEYSVNDDRMDDDRGKMRGDDDIFDEGDFHFEDVRDRNKSGSVGRKVPDLSEQTPPPSPTLRNEKNIRSESNGSPTLLDHSNTSVLVDFDTRPESQQSGFPEDKQPRNSRNRAGSPIAYRRSGSPVAYRRSGSPIAFRRSGSPVVYHEDRTDSPIEILHPVANSPSSPQPHSRSRSTSKTRCSRSRSKSKTPVEQQRSRNPSAPRNNSNPVKARPGVVEERSRRRSNSPKKSKNRSSGSPKKQAKSRSRSPVSHKRSRHRSPRSPNQQSNSQRRRSRHRSRSKRSKYRTRVSPRNRSRSRSPERTPNSTKREPTNCAGFSPMGTFGTNESHYNSRYHQSSGPGRPAEPYDNFRKSFNNSNNWRGRGRRRGRGNGKFNWRPFNNNNYYYNNGYRYNNYNMTFKKEKDTADANNYYNQHDVMQGNGTNYEHERQSTFSRGNSNNEQSPATYPNPQRASSPTQAHSFPPKKCFTVEERLRIIKTCPESDCDMYNHTFRTRELARKHLQDVHKLQHCDVCLELLDSQGLVHKQHFLVQHTNIKDKKERASCPICQDGKTFKYQGMYNHLAKIHYIPLEQKMEGIRRTSTKTKPKGVQMQKVLKDINKTHLAAASRISTAASGRNSTFEHRSPTIGRNSSSPVSGGGTGSFPRPMPSAQAQRSQGSEPRPGPSRDCNMPGRNSQQPQASERYQSQGSSRPSNDVENNLVNMPRTFGNNYKIPKNRK